MREASGVYGRTKYLSGAHTSGTYPAVGEDAAWKAGASKAEHTGARTAEQLGAAAHRCRAVAWHRPQWRRRGPLRSRRLRERRGSVRELSAGCCRRRVGADDATRMMWPVRRGRVRAALARLAPTRGSLRRRREWERPSAAKRLRGAWDRTARRRLR
eukprot:823830-Pleurochrysis_carterae.AAC.2